MAAGAAPAPEKTGEATAEATETAQVAQSEPTTLKGRIIARLHEIFHGRDEYLGWRQ